MSDVEEQLTEDDGPSYAEMMAHLRENHGWKITRMCLMRNMEEAEKQAQDLQKLGEGTHELSEATPDTLLFEMQVKGFLNVEGHVFDKDETPLDIHLEVEPETLVVSRWVTMIGVFWAINNQIHFIIPSAGVGLNLAEPQHLSEAERNERREVLRELNARNIRLGLTPPPNLNLPDDVSRTQIEQPAKRGRPPKEKPQSINVDRVPYFKSRHSTGNMGTALAHAAELRGIPDPQDKRHIILAPANKKGPKSKNKEAYSLAYQMPLGLDFETVSTDEFLIANLGLSTFRYLLAVEYLYQYRDRTDGTLYVQWADLLSVMNMTDRTDNRRRVRNGLLAAAELRVYCSTVAEKEIVSNGKRSRRLIATHRFDPFLTVDPISFSDGRRIRPQEAVVMARNGQLDLFDGLAIRLSHAVEDQNYFCFVPRAALELSSKSQLQGLAIGRFLLSVMCKDWLQYGGVWRMPIFPDYPHGSTGNFTRMIKQGLLHQAGLATQAKHKIRIMDQLPEWLEHARKSSMLGRAEWNEETNTIEGVAPLWLWRTMQLSETRAYKGEEPEYVKQLERAEKFK
jgi:hypothetical protein